MDFAAIITNFINQTVWPIFTGVCVIMLIWAGILFATAAGDPAKITKARNAALFAVIGFILGILAFSAPGFFKNILRNIR